MVWMSVRRLTPLVVALPFLCAADLGTRQAASTTSTSCRSTSPADEQNLTNDPAFDVAPAVARDGRIAFVSTRGGEGRRLRTKATSMRTATPRA